MLSKEVCVLQYCVSPSLVELVSTGSAVSLKISETTCAKSKPDEEACLETERLDIDGGVNVQGSIEEFEVTYGSLDVVDDSNVSGITLCLATIIFNAL